MNQQGARRVLGAAILVGAGAVAGRTSTLPLEGAHAAMSKAAVHQALGATGTGASTAGSLAQGHAFNLTPPDQQLTGTSRTVGRQVVQVENVGVGLGSGVIATSNGYIVTNNHVVEGGSQYAVTLWDGRRVPAKLVGTAAFDDLAVLRINVSGLSAARFGDSDRLQVGQQTLAIGNPLGLGETVTVGVVSALRRTVSEDTQTGAYLPHAIQTSAQINPGNSGGALVSLDGQVIGIPTLAAGSPMGGAAQGIGFAIPSNRVLAIVPQLIKNGRVLHTGRAYLGIGTTDPTANGQSGQGSLDQATGVIVANVTSGGPAGRAGLAVGDIIVSLAGRPVQNRDALVSVLADLKVGQTVAVTIMRPDASGGAARLTKKVTVGELPANPR